MSVDTVLIANRGEIAVRIARACGSLGIRSVAVYSEADRGAAHVDAADDAFCIGPGAALDSYLNIDAVIAAARAAGATAVHPGYGFLAENAAFARACAAAGLAFVGPPPDVIAVMGSKIRARVAALAAGVPVVPGCHGEVQDDDALAAAARGIGYPLMIKASAGGGGRGMRRVHDGTAFAGALSLARGEAASAFGDDTVLLERLVERARHIEVQVLADRHGNVVHLFDRDCSVQRHHQKLIEEAPAPALSEDLRSHMLEQSVALARAIGYEGAGTVEFIYDLDESRHYFLEMNTRLQVEHPVTEAVTGVDIVEWQLRIAAGEPLGFDQQQVACHGHAIEARIAAEDPAAGFLPQTGVVRGYREPAGTGIRVDSGIAAGSCIGHHYDSMLAKVIAHGANRELSRRRLVRALGDLRIDGVKTNTAFVRDVVNTPAFSRALHATDLIDTAFKGGWRRAQPSPRQLAEVALGGLLVRRAAGDDAPWTSLGAWRLTSAAGVTAANWCYALPGNGDRHTVRLARQGSAFLVEVDGANAIEAFEAAWTGSALIYETRGRRRRAEIDFRGDTGWHVECHGIPIRLLRPEQVLSPARSAAAHGDNCLRATMPGRLTEIRVVAGDEVAAGQPLAVLEAMKMYQELTAPMAGVVAMVHRAAGETVDGGASILEIEPHP